jgi:hypothetical protein
MRLPKITITREKNKDTGFVVLLGLLLWYLHSGDVSVLCVIVSLVAPVVLKPVSYAWNGLSEVMGTVISRVLLCAIFFCIVTPVGAVRRAISKERLLSEQWKTGGGSVFKDRNVCYKNTDLKNQF